MLATTSTDKVLGALSNASRHGLLFDELAHQTGIHTDHLESLLNNLRRNKKVKTMYGRWYLPSITPTKRAQDEAEAIHKERKRVLISNAEIVGLAIYHHKAAIVSLKDTLQELVDQIQIERIEVPEKISLDHLVSGPRKVIWSEQKRRDYRKSIIKEAKKQ